MSVDIKKDLRYGSEKHTTVLAAILRRFQYSKDKMEERHDVWRDSDNRHLAYAKETTVDAARRETRENYGVPQYTTIQIPQSYAVHMTALTYHTSVFYSRAPTYQFEGTSGGPEQSKFAVEALIDYQFRQAGMLPVGYQWLSDVGKYGLGIIGTFWDEMQVIVNKVVDKEDEFLGVALGTTQKEFQRTTVKGYQGNRSYNVRPYDFYPDPRQTPINLQKGEYVGVVSDVHWNHIAKMAGNGKYFNTGIVKKMNNSGFVERVEGGAATNSAFRPGGTGSLNATDMDNTTLLEMYIELIPKDWGIGPETFPEKWVFIVADETVIIAGRPLGDIANTFPFDVLESEPDGYAMFKPSIIERTQPFEDITNWLINTHFYNVRKTLNDQFVVDPSKVVMKDLLNGVPGGIIRLKEEFYDSDVRSAITQLPVQDITRAHLSDMEMINQQIARFTGISDNLMGMVNAGGRKTATEVRSSTTFGINRLKTQAEWYSATGFASHSKRMLQQSQQYYDQQLKLRIVGDTARFSGLNHLEVTPEDISGFFDFVPIDGTLPVDRFAQVSMWSNLLAQARNIPQIGQTYDLGKIFGWVAQLGGIKNIDQFKVEVVPDQQLADQAQAGNVVALNGQSGTGQPPGKGQTREGGTPYSSQTPGVGPSG